MMRSIGNLIVSRKKLTRYASRDTLHAFLVFSLLLINSCFAVSKDTSAQATVKVSSVFELKIAEGSISDFGNAKAGQWIEIPMSGNYANAVICKSNNANAWQLKIKAGGPLSNSTYSIPISNFKWMSIYAGSKNAPYQSLIDGLKHKPAENYQSFSLIDETVYSSGASDNSNLPEGTEIQFKYALLIPDNQKLPTGIYTSTVIYTMTE